MIDEEREVKEDLVVENWIDGYPIDELVNTSDFTREEVIDILIQAGYQKEVKKQLATMETKELGASIVVEVLESVAFDLVYDYQERWNFDLIGFARYERFDDDCYGFTYNVEVEDNIEAFVTVQFQETLVIALWLEDIVKREDEILPSELITSVDLID
jgi:hypothetical protein